jgi:hypothetical protein
MIHHVQDLNAAARELRRVVCPEGPILIRSAVAGRPQAITLFRFFTEAVRVLDRIDGIGRIIQMHIAPAQSMCARLDSNQRP